MSEDQNTALVSGALMLRDWGWSLAGSAPITAPSQGHITGVQLAPPGCRLVQVAKAVGLPQDQCPGSASVTQPLMASAKPLPSHQMCQDGGREAEHGRAVPATQPTEQEGQEIPLLPMCRAAGRACGGNSEG